MALMAMALCEAGRGQEKSDRICPGLARVLTLACFPDSGRRCAPVPPITPPVFRPSNHARQTFLGRTMFAMFACAERAGSQVSS